MEESNRKPKLFEYAIIWHPNHQQAKDGQKSKIVVQPTVVLAVDDRAASILAARAIPSEYQDSLDQVEIALHPF